MPTTPLRVTLAALFGAGVLAIGAPLAQAQTDTHKSSHTVPGDNETVKIHRSTTPDHDRRNQPHVCTFYLVGFGFDANQTVSWHINSWPPTGDKSVVRSGTLVMDQDGFRRTADMSLPNGHYKLYWTFNGEHGKAKHKVFWVKCEESSPSQTPSSTPTTSKPSTSTPSTPPGNVPSTPSGNVPSSPSSNVPSFPSSPSPTPSAGVPTPVPTKLPVTG